MKESLSIILESTEIIITQNEEYLKEALTIQRSSPYQVYHGHVPLSSQNLFPKRAFGIVGIIELLRGPYLILITQTKSCGFIEFPEKSKHEVFLVEEVSLLPLDSNPRHLNLEEERDELQYTQMIVELLSNSSFYFSYSYDLSNSFQRNNSLLKSKVSSPKSSNPPKLENTIWGSGDQRFLWNFYTQKFFIKSWNQIGTFDSKFLVGLIQGFFRVENNCHLIVPHPEEVNERGGEKITTNFSTEKQEFTFGIISRRSNRRVGTRLHSRGADNQGNVSNYAETEQFLQLMKDGALQTSSYVQVRGSIPLLWNHEVNLDYDPAISISTSNANEVLSLHFEEQIKLYQKQNVVNLVKEKGGERELGLKFGETINSVLKTMNNASDLKYFPFDVYKHCGHSKYENLIRLVEQIGENEFKEMGYFFTDGNQFKNQVGVFRTNCKDCLDRTNLVQALFAKLSLIQQLQDFGLLKIEGPISLEVQKKLDKTDFFFLFRSSWGDNGDAISIQYAGTPALKRDVTRIGKQTAGGMLGDGISSVSRYVYNNMVDGYKQDAMILFTGGYQVSKGDPSPFSIRKDFGLPSTFLNNWITSILGLILSVFGILGPKSLKQKGYLLVISFCLLVLWFFSKVLRIEGKTIANVPQLKGTIKRKNQ